MSTDDLTRRANARNAIEREGVCRTCLRPIWREGGTIGHRRQDHGWSDRIERGGDSLVCFQAIHYRHEPLTGREAAIYDQARSVLADEVDRLRAEADRWKARSVTAGTDLDAARAALERLRAIHARRPFDYARDLVTFGQETFPDRCTGCRGADYPCQTIRALEGKPS